MSKFLVYLFLFSNCVFAQESPTYNEVQKLYDYQIADIEKREAEMKAANFSDSQVQSALIAIKKQSLWAANRIFNREKSLNNKISMYEDDAERLQNYSKSVVKYFRDMAVFNGDSRNYSDEEIISILISRGDSTLARQPKNTTDLKAELRKLHSDELSLIRKSQEYLDQVSAGEPKVSIQPSERDRYGISPHPIQNSTYFLGHRIAFTNLTSDHLEFKEKYGETGIVTGITFTNDYSSKNNPNGCREGFTEQSDCWNSSKYPNRDFNFRTRNGNPNEFSLSIRDWTATSGSVSADEMNTSLFFVPRKTLPQMYFDKESGHIVTVLPTGEKIFHDPVTMEVKSISGNSLDFAPIDREPNRHQRKFAGVTYNGTGVMIRMDARGRLPENTHSTSFNVNENGSKAILTYQGKSCKVDKADLIDISSTPPILKYDDQELNEKILKPICGWDITDLLSEVGQPEVNIEAAGTSIDPFSNADFQEKSITPASMSNIELAANCEDLIKEYFNDGKKREELISYLQTQGKITLHRLALVALKKRKEGESIQSTIENLLKKRNVVKHEEFVHKSRDTTRNQSLLKIMGELHQESQASELEDNQKLSKEDLYMVEFLVRAEKQHGQSAKSGVMNYLSIIKNSIGDDTEKDAKNIEKMSEVVESLSKKQDSFNNETLDFLKENNCYSANNEQSTCERDPASTEEMPLVSLIKGQNKILESLLKSINQDSEMSKEVFQWNTYWLHVK